MDVYEEMAGISRAIADSFPPPDFYRIFARDLERARAFFSEDETVAKCRTIVRERLSANYGHGLDHADKVAVEAGALAAIEGRIVPLYERDRERAGLLCHIAGVLHDLRRGEENHALLSAEAAGEVLRGMSFSAEDEAVITSAISNHEAFVPPRALGSPLAQLVSDALYDADKFRWGPDNFTVTLWEMLRSSRAPLAAMARRFPKGVKGIARIKETFRTATGKEYGPEFIDVGLKIGEELYRVLVERFPPE